MMDENESFESSSLLSDKGRAKRRWNIERRRHVFYVIYSRHGCSPAVKALSRLVKRRDKEDRPGETESSSGLSNYDVAIYCHGSVISHALEAERLLIENHDITTCLSYRDSPSVRPKLANLYSVAKHSRLKVFIINGSFVSEDLDYHVRLLENPTVCSKRNSLIIMQKKYRKSLPGHLRDLTHKFFDFRISADEIVNFITEFWHLHGLESEVTADIEDSQSEEELQPIRRTALKNKKEERLHEDQLEHNRFQESFGKITKKRCYVLITSPIRERSPSLRYTACIPWVRVFDFDAASSSRGVLLWADEDLSTKNVVKTSKPDQIETPDDGIINWVSITGESEYTDGQHNRNVTIPESVILRHGESLADHCIARKVPIILVMWYPDNSNLDKTLDDFLTGLRHHLKGRLNSFECIICVKEMPNKRSPLYRTLDRLGIIESTIAVPVETLCNWLKECSNIPFTAPMLSPPKILPKYPEEGEELGSTEIAEEELVWVRSHIYVLVKSPENGSDVAETSDATETLGNSFLRGGRIHWDVLKYGGYDVNRDLLEKVKCYIEDRHISTGRTGLITIYHAPGGGGTTFARRLLYELHDKVPCGELLSDRISVKNLEERLVTLRNLTFLPTVLLMDGNSMHDVKKILAMEAKVRIIVIHVRRYVRESEKATSSDNKFFLGAKVSNEESKGFASVYTKAVPSKSKALSELCRRTAAGEHHYIFEYGMTTFHSQFKGVRSYVHGYLQVHDAADLQNWHKVLAFLSIANYYGHRGLPSKLFSKLLGKHGGDIVELEDLPHAARQFITEEDDTWKITHHVVSKLILEQVLVRRQDTDYETRDNQITSEASKELCLCAMNFIDNVTDYVGTPKKVVPHIWEILTSIFIRRNYDDPGENETGYKTHYSKLIEDIGTSHEQKTIFEKLVASFPGQAEFRAHLGRFHSKQGQFEQAMKCFMRALEVRKQDLRAQEHYRVHSKYQEQTKPDDVLERIYNMSAFACISHIRTRIGARMGKLTGRKLKGKNLPELIRFCLQKANEAIKNFENGRLYYQKSSNPSFANLGELKVRLQLSELGKQVSDSDFTALLSKQSPYPELGKFVLESFHECDLLLAQCISDRSKQIEIPEEEINMCFNNFNFFYKNATAALQKWAGNDSSMHSLKCHLSILKTKLRQSNKSAANRRHFKVNEDVQTGEEISELVQLCEKICDKVLSENSNTRISSYMMDWLRAIRHTRMTKKYTQHDVLSRIEKWKSRNETGSSACFYYYAVSTVISISSLSRETANLYAEKSRKIRDYMRQNDVMPFYNADTTEWLGNDTNSHDFNRLIHFSDLGEWNGKFWTDPEQISKLQVCSGFILYCRPHDGIISMDGDHDVQIHVFFVPHKYGIGLSQSQKKTRVEFYLAFNIRHFAQAYEVTPLKKYACPNPSCRVPTEISTLGKDPSEFSTKCNFCETLVSAT